MKNRIGYHGPILKSVENRGCGNQRRESERELKTASAEEEDGGCVGKRDVVAKAEEIGRKLESSDVSLW